jgi:hypothetical protein
MAICMWACEHASTCEHYMCAPSSRSRVQASMRRGRAPCRKARAPCAGRTTCPLRWVYTMLPVLVVRLPSLNTSTSGPPLSVPAVSRTTDTLPGDAILQKLIKNLRDKVKQDKDDVFLALKDPNQAATSYFAQLAVKIASLKAQRQALPQHLVKLDKMDGRKLQAAIKQFKAALQELAKRNAEAGPDLSFGINEFTFLSPEEFSALYLSTMPVEDAYEPRPTVDGGAQSRRRLSRAAEAGGSSLRRGRRLAQAVTGPTCTSIPWYTWALTAPSQSTPPDSVDWRAPGAATPFPAITPVRNQGGVSAGCGRFQAARVVGKD